VGAGYAVGLLADLGATEAIEPMLRVLAATDGLDLLHDRIIQRLPRLGAPVLEPALRAYGQTDDPEFRWSLCQILADLKIRAERVVQILLDQLRADPAAGAMNLAEYGDARALGELQQSFEVLEIDSSDTGHIPNHAFIELRGAIELLGGALSEEQLAKYREAMKPADRLRARLHTAIAAPRRERNRRKRERKQRRNRRRNKGKARGKAPRGV
jgi:hypothetical protein